MGTVKCSITFPPGDGDLGASAPVCSMTLRAVYTYAALSRIFVPISLSSYDQPKTPIPTPNSSLMFLHLAILRNADANASSPLNPKPFAAYTPHLSTGAFFH
jgi:hypothetical protein